MIPAGQTVDVPVSVNVADLGLYNAAMQYVVEPGQFEIFMAKDSSDETRSTSFWVS
jgi:beta-glucosidase